MGFAISPCWPKSSPHRRAILSVLGVLLLQVFVPVEVRAQAPPSEAAVKAAFVYNFAKFVEWPAAREARSGRLHLCIWGAEPLGGALNGLAGKPVRKWTIEVRSEAHSTGTAGCDIVFVGNTLTRAEAEAALKQSSVPGTLTIGDRPDFAAAGGVINMYRSGARIRFEVNLTAARQAGLRISAKLLRLAKIIGQK